MKRTQGQKMSVSHRRGVILPKAGFDLVADSGGLTNKLA